MTDIYDKEKWGSDSTFSATPGQEITEDVYNEMLNCMPPKYLSAEAQEKAHDKGLCIFAGFMMGEPHSCDKQGTLYLAFGMSSGKYYYLGLAHQ